MPASALDSNALAVCTAGVHAGKRFPPRHFLAHLRNNDSVSANNSGSAAAGRLM
jgi:hypothetical protein